MANNLKGELNRLSPMRKSALAICIFMLGWFLLTFPLIGIDYGNIIGTVLFAALIGYIIKMPEVNSGIKKFWHTKCGRFILSAAAAAAAHEVLAHHNRDDDDLCLSESLRQK